MLYTLTSVRKAQLISVLLIVAVTACGWYYVHAYIKPDISITDVSELLLAVAYAGGFVLLLSEAARVRVGVYNNQLALHDQVDNKAFTSSSELVLYGGRRIAFGFLSAPTGNTNAQAYELAPFAKDVYPLLANARIIKPKTMLIWKPANHLVGKRETVIKVLLIGMIMLVSAIISMMG